ncbi:MAG TPA: hypothetical protein VKY85_27015 [Candidatus Angelobacter sp.]|nr:hypothetical protein [Candidatus Angelobacter sp.]
MNKRFLLDTLLLVLLLPAAAMAHIGSPDVYYDGHAGPYHLLVTVRPSPVVPGVAEIQVRSAANDISEIKIRPLRLVGPGANLAPKPDLAQQSSDDPQLFTGKLWIMDRGSWQVQIQIAGQHGNAELGVPVPAVSTYSVRMQKTLGGMLSVLGLLLVCGLIGMVGAASRDAKLPPGEMPTAKQSRKGYITMTVAGVLVIAVLIGAKLWWADEASANEKLAYKLPQAELSLVAGNKLQLILQNPNEEAGFFTAGKDRIERVDRLRLDDLVPDHGHLLHLFLVRMPDMKSFWHLHPDQEATAAFNQELPGVPAGHYQVYADIVHATGFPETEVAEIDLPAITGKPVSNDDSGVPDLQAGETVSQLSNGYHMVWERDQAPLKTRQPFWFRFRIEDPSGKPATDLQDYMGMAGHAVFLRSDGKVFAHVHPAGSVSMAAVDLASGQKPGQTQDMASMPGMNAPKNGEVSFPYGFPQPGDYHIFVQVRRAGHVETGAFVAHVAN